LLLVTAGAENGTNHRLPTLQRQPPLGSLDAAWSPKGKYLQHIVENFDVYLIFLT
jgi:hypothetical protein